MGLNRGVTDHFFLGVDLVTVHKGLFGFRRSGREVAFYVSSESSWSLGFGGEIASW